MMERNKLMTGIFGGTLLLAPPFQESEGFLGIDWWVWILGGVLLLLLLLIIGYVMQNEPGEPIPKRESKIYVTAASVAKKEAEAKTGTAEEPPAPEPEPEPEPEPDPTPDPEPELEPEPVKVDETAEPDDLIRIEGIGPKVADLLNKAGITTFAALAETDMARLNQILDEAKLQYMEPASWPQQAALAARGDWKEFEKLTAELKGGRQES